MCTRVFFLDARISTSETQTETATLHFDTKQNDIISCICSIDDNQFISGSVEGCVNITNWSQDKTISLTDAHDSTVTCIKYNSIQNFFVTSSRDKLIKFWSAENMDPTLNTTTDNLEPKFTFKGHLKGITSIDIAKNCPNLSQKLWSGGRDARTIVWDVETQKQLVNRFVDRNLTRALRIIPDSIDSSNDNNLIQCCEDLKLRIWDARTGGVHTTVETGDNIPLSLDIDSNGWYCAVTFNGFQGMLTSLNQHCMIEKDIG